MILEIISKLASESLLSLYPIFVKNIGLPLSLQTWSRCFSYAIISGFFIDYSFVLKTLFTYNGMMLSIVTLIHIYTSYKGFQLLESGVAYSVFYLYPIMILLMSGQKIHYVMILALVGVYLLSSKPINFDSLTNNTNNIFITKNVSFEKSNELNETKIKGLIMILLAAFTEAVIYFLVRDIKTTNNWNHIFISYFLGAVMLSGYMIGDISKIELNSRLSLSLIINSLIGLVGYLLRFYAVSNLETIIYAPLSYFGIVMSFVYGIFINGETIDLQKIVGACLIIFSNLLLL
jgi:drug/metabolite transporter (DMT)-like permease